MQHSPLDPRSNLAGETRQVRIAPLFPARDQAVEFAWSDSAARRRLDARRGDVLWKFRAGSGVMAAP